ncbi:MAG: YfhO family protein [Candidatus Hydrogenedentota bacterium]
MSTNSPEEPSHSDTKGYLLALAAFTGICLVMFGDLIFNADGNVISYRLSDGSQYFTRMRAFGFRELANGNMPLWNPHIYSGTPFVGGFQSAMFYPFNLIYLAFSVDTAMNIDVAFHVILTGFFMFCWARGRGLRWDSSFLAGMMLAFGGACFSRVMAGHITMLQAFAWAPLVMLSIDHIFKRPSTGWVLVGVFATSMQILAGHPQSLFMTGLMAALYCMLRLINCPHRGKAILAFIPFGIVPPLIACVQLWTGLDVASESMRSVGTEFNFASSYSLHPESLLGFLAPTFYGNMIHLMYWGRWAFWDSTMFMSIAGLFLAGYGIAIGTDRQRWIFVTIIILFITLALGRYTPVYQIVFEHLPVFNAFRAPGKLMYPASILIAMLAAMGFDAFMNREHRSRVFAMLPAIPGLIILAIAGTMWVSITRSNMDFFEGMVDLRRDSGDTFFFWTAGFDLSKEYYYDAATLMYYSVLVAGITIVLIAILQRVSIQRRHWRYGLFALAIIEVLVFARLHRPTFSLDDHKRELFDEVIAQIPGDYRILDVPGIDNSRRNYAVDTERFVIWGYDPVILERYATFVVFAGGRSHDTELTKGALTGGDPVAQAIHWQKSITFSEDGIDGDLELFKLLRTKYIIVAPGEWGLPSSLWPVEGAFQRFHIMNEYLICEDKDAVFEALGDKNFPADKLALVEQELDPKPATLKPGERVTASINILDQSTDHVTIEVEVDKATLLVMTDSYSKNWHATALDDSVQSSYDLIPVDYTLRGIPITAGKHHIRIEYTPESYTIGRWISLLSTIAFFIAVMMVLIRKPHKSQTESLTNE